MARRNFEMHHYRQALLRMRQGDSDRDIAAAQVMGDPRPRSGGASHRGAGWLDLAQPPYSLHEHWCAMTTYSSTNFYISG